MATLALTDLQKDTLTLSAVDAAGNPTTLPAGAVSWATSNAAVLSVAPSADGMSCDIAAVGPLGVAQVSVAVQVDPAPAPPLTGTVDVTVGASSAASIVIVAGTPVNK